MAPHCCYREECEKVCLIAFSRLSADMLEEREKERTDESVSTLRREYTMSQLKRMKTTGASDDSQA